MTVLARLLFPVEAQAEPPAPAEGRAVELAARAHEAALRADRAAAARLVGEMLADGWWGPLVEAAVLRRMAEVRAG